MNLSPNARWLALGVVALLGVSTSVAAVRNSRDDAETARERPPVSAPAPAAPSPERSEPAAVPASPETGIAQPGRPAAPPMANAGVRIGDRTTHRAASAAAVPVRLGDRTTVIAVPAPSTAAEPEPVPASSERTGTPPPTGSEPERGASGGAPETAPPSPGATPQPAPETLVHATVAVNLEPVLFVVRAGSNPGPDADVTVGEEQVVGDAPPPEKTEVGIGGELIPLSTRTWTPPGVVPA